MKPIDILTSRNLKRTSCREGIIEVVMKAPYALSENEIREQLAGTYDRTTFYRSFKTLEEYKIIHKIVVDNQLVKYALANTLTGRDDHAHFFCHSCHAVQCMASVPVMRYQLPDDYTDVETEVLIRGICSKCKTASH